MFRINLDLGDLSGLQANVKEKASQLLKDAARRLASSTHDHIQEKVKQQLHSTRSMYLKNLRRTQMDENTVLIELAPEAMFLEEGMSAHEMIDDLLKGTEADGVHTAKDGSRWRVIPMKQNKLPQDTPESTSDLQSTIKKYMRKNKIPYGKIETNGDGSPKLGLLHSFDIENAPLKTKDGPGQGWGGIGDVKQGPTGIPFLQGVRVYQRAGKDKAGKDTVQKDIMTFRIVSSKMKGTGRWMHPGLPARKFFDEAYEWALQQWEKEIRPDLEAEIAGD